jgi:rod shape-determining protein MreD
LDVFRVADPCRLRVKGVPVRWWRVLLTLALLLVLQTTLVPWLELAGSRPNLFLIFAVWCGLEWPLEKSYWPSWLAGLTRDLFSGARSIGAYAALYLLLAVLLGRIRRALFVEHILTQVSVVAASSVATEGVWLLLWFHARSADASALLWRVGGETLYTVLVTPPVLGLLWCLGWRWRWR